MTQVVGWIGVLLFLIGGYFLGSSSLNVRINSIISFSIANFCFVLQGCAMENWSLVSISSVAVFLNLRVAYRWANGKV